MDESCRGRTLVRAGLLGDRLAADRAPNRVDPRLPLIGGLWFGIGVQQQAAADRAGSMLAFQLDLGFPQDREGFLMPLPVGQR
jgi:hypothetical protein